MKTPRSKLRGIKDQRQKTSKQFQLDFLVMKPFIVLLSPLILHIPADDFFTTMTSYRTDKVAFGPKYEYIRSYELRYHPRIKRSKLRGIRPPEIEQALDRSVTAPFAAPAREPFHGHAAADGEHRLDHATQLAKGRGLGTLA
jgi:hypothetical protein